MSYPVGKVCDKEVAIERFFITVTAGAKDLYADFADLTLQDETAGPVEL
jgi:hypothetical protein